MQVESDSPLVGKTIESAGLRHLPGLFLAEIDRDGNAMPAVSPREDAAGGRPAAVRRHRGIDCRAAADSRPGAGGGGCVSSQAPRPQRCLIEAVVSNTCPLVGMTIRESRFRSHYNAVVVAVARNGQRLHQKIGDIVLHAGDVLLVEAHPSFADQQRSSRDFFLVSKVEESTPPRHELALLGGGHLAAMVLAMSGKDCSKCWPALLPCAGGGGGLVSAVFDVDGGDVAAAADAGRRDAFRSKTARKSIDWEVLLGDCRVVRPGHGPGENRRGDR